MDNIEIYDFLTYFYRSPAPEKATDVLRWFVHDPRVQDPLSAAPMEYFFARLAQLYPNVVGELDAVLSGAPKAAKRFASGLRKSLRGTRRQPFNAADRPICTATDNDLLWAEFMLTGNRKPIVRLIDQLESPDLARAKLEERLGGLTELTIEKLRDVGIEVDLDRGTIETAGDLDCLCLMEGLCLSPRLAEVRKVSPLLFTDDDVMAMGVKATAKWSLASNANRHPWVLATCEEELARRTGNAVTALQEIVDHARRGARDYDRAMELRKAADQGDADAQCTLGLMHERGSGVHQDLELAAAWYARAAEQGHADAQFRLGSALEQGGCVPIDDAAAEESYRKAAAQGSAEAQNRLGQILEGAEAVQWCRRAAEQGLPEAQYYLGVRYCDGNGVEQDDVEAVGWYRKAAEQGDVEGQYALGDMYYHGRGVEQDYEEAAKWLRRAAEQEDDVAQQDLVEMFAAGLTDPLPGEPDSWPKPEYMNVVLPARDPALGCFLLFLVAGAVFVLTNAIWGWRAALVALVAAAFVAVVWADESS
jgi:TPR repeat protein